jgi:hypothetical protein
MTKEIVPAGKPLAAVVSDDAVKALQLREAEQARLRAERERHHHKQIWSKHPHGGAYYPVASTTVKASRPDQQQLAVVRSGDLPNGARHASLGYEHVIVGATTNIVGDAMSAVGVYSMIGD